MSALFLAGTSFWIKDDPHLWFIISIQSLMLVMCFM